VRFSLFLHPTINYLEMLEAGKWNIDCYYFFSCIIIKNSKENKNYLNNAAAA